MRDFHTLDIWKKSHRLTLHVYKLTKELFPKEELYGLQYIPNEKYQELSSEIISIRKMIIRFMDKLKLTAHHPPLIAHRP